MWGNRALGAFPLLLSLFAAPAVLQAAETNRPPHAAIEVLPEAMVTGQRVMFDARKSTDVDGRVVRYAWDLNGNGTFERNTGGRPLAARSYARAGPVEVTLLVIDNEGGSDTVRAVVVVRTPDRGVKPVPPDRVRRRAARVEPGAGPDRPEVPAVSAAGKPARPPASSQAGRTPRAAAAPEPTARAAAAKTVAISDFKFAPATLTVAPGDTVTWTNSDSVKHSAKADGFDTGLLAKGATGSHTFEEEGTFAYVCAPHPFMKGTIKVEGDGGGDAASGDASTDGSSDVASSSAGSGTTDSGSDGGSLADTGTDVIGLMLGGLLLLAAGMGIRRAGLARDRGRA